MCAMKKSRGLSILFVVVLLAVAIIAEAQQPKKVHRIGFLAPGSLSAYSTQIEAFRHGLRDLGYIEEKNIAVEYRYPERNFDQLAGELVRLKLDVIVVGGMAAIRAVKQATSTIPIVMAAVGDAVGSGFVTSLARPGGNITGLSFLSPEVRGKQLELLKELFPKVSRVVVFHDPTFYPVSKSLTEMEIVSRSLGLQVQFLEVRSPDEFEGAFKIAVEKRAGALLISAHPVFSVNRKRLADLVAKGGLPAMYPWREFVEAGGLIAYGPSLEDLYRRAAVYVDKILKGTKPADLPVEQPTKFEFIINLKAAKQIGLTIPQSVLYRADKVIK
jgi:putative tryptophan/tyrosine transport system substrate-binding protein